MPSSAKPGQAQPEAVRFSQLKKKNFWGFSPLVLTIERPLQIYQEAQYSPKGGFKNLEFNFFAYLFLLSHRFCQGRSILRKKTSRFSKGKEYYPQKKVYVTFEMCRSSKKSDDLYSRRAGILKRRPCSTFIQPLRQSNTSRTSVWVKRFRKYRSVRRSARKCNASRMQTTLEWISELVCSALTCCWK